MQILKYLPNYQCVAIALAFVSNLTFSSTLMAEESLAQRHEKATEILETIQRNISLNAEQESQLINEIAKLTSDQRTLNQQLIQATTESRALEKKAEKSGRQIVKLEEQRDHLRASLSTKTALLSEVLAALQRMGRNPPPALLVTPQDALVSVRSAILLGSVIPEIRTETNTLSAQLEKLSTIGKKIDAERAKLTTDLELAAKQEQRLTLLIAKKKKAANRANETLAAQGVAAAKLAAKATNLTNLIKQLESEIDAVNAASQAAKQAEKERIKREDKQIATAREEASRPDFSDTSRIAPVVEFPAAKGHLVKPVNGVEIRKFGARDELGDPSPGIAIATRANARVISPADGWVVYSGPFRSYGQLIILNVGSNYHIVMSGMQKVDVDLGQFVLVGEPVGIMGSTRIASAGTIDVGLSRPILSIEFRKQSEPIDPAPWWQVNTDKRSNDDS